VLPLSTLVTVAIGVLAVTAAARTGWTLLTVSPAIAALPLDVLGPDTLAVPLPPALAVASIPGTYAVDT